MPRLFGTDGIRGVANVDLKPPLALALGRATASLLLQDGRPLLVGQDTRRSCDMLVAAIIAGATSMGADVHRLGVCPTPALAFVTDAGAYGAGIMVSASHNPAEDNGLKVLDRCGMKMEDEIEDELEALIWRSDELPSPTNDGIGREVDARAELDRYRASRLDLARRSRIDFHVALDCANGSASEVAPGDPARDRRTRQRPFRPARRGQHQRRVRRHRAGDAGCHGARDPCERRVRPRRRCRPMRSRRRTGAGRGR